MLYAKRYIEAHSCHSVILPELTRFQDIRDIQGDDVTFTRIKNRLTKENFKNVENSDILFIINPTHRSVINYVGGNAFMEMVLAFYLNKPIYLLNDIPDNMSYTEEMKSFYPVVVRNYETLLQELEKKTSL